MHFRFGQYLVVYSPVTYRWDIFTLHGVFVQQKLSLTEAREFAYAN